MMKKAWFLNVLKNFLYVSISLFIFTAHSYGQPLYYPSNYQQLYAPYGYGYQQPYYPYMYQQPYSPYPNWYQQPYSPYPNWYQQPYSPYPNWYQQPYAPYPDGYYQPYYPYMYQQPYSPYSNWYQQPYAPYPNGYYQPYYPYMYQQPYSPYSNWYQQPYYPISGGYPFYSSSTGSSTVDVCGIPGTGQYGKPAIYLYPQEDTYISVELDIDGQITQTIPSYNDGWYVLAKPDGDIFDRRDGYIQDKPYDYLFWEAETDLSELELPDQGWVVAKGDLEGWFSTNLPLLGLNEKEKAQFMEYWLERLSESAYYELKLLSSEFLAKHATLIITPQPDTLIRVIFTFKPLDAPKTIEAPNIETQGREGFVVLEWGGILVE